MSQSEINLLEKRMLEFKAKIDSSKSEAKKLLIEIGILNKKGTLNKEYKQLCTQQGRG